MGCNPKPVSLTAHWPDRVGVCITARVKSCWHCACSKSVEQFFTLFLPLSFSNAGMGAARSDVTGPEPEAAGAGGRGRGAGVSVSTPQRPPTTHTRPVRLCRDHASSQAGVWRVEEAGAGAEQPLKRMRLYLARGRSPAGAACGDGGGGAEGDAQLGAAGLSGRQRPRPRKPQGKR